MPILELILYIAFFLIVGSAAYAGLIAAPWVPTKRKHMASALKLINPHKDMIFVDLGCGDGRLVQEVARQGAHAVGYEISLIPYLVAKLRTWSLREHCHVYCKNFWKADLSKADVVYVFLMPKVSERMKRKLRAELKPGSRVITYIFPLEGWTPVEVQELEGDLQLSVYQM